jgi:hypothetical protein
MQIDNRIAAASLESFIIPAPWEINLLIVDSEREEGNGSLRGEGSWVRGEGGKARQHEVSCKDS